MKIGIFDSGLGGLIVARAICKTMPGYDYVYLGDTKRVPYGNRSHETVFKFTKQAVNYLFKKENCALIIIACNTASARALRRIQKEYKNKKILGVLIPGAEAVRGFKRVGVLATKGTVASKSFIKEIRKVDKTIKVFQKSAPLLVPLVEKGNIFAANRVLKKYLIPLLAKNVGALILGCTHYPILKKEIKKYVGKNVKIISQDEIVPKKLKNYLLLHPEINKELSKKRNIKILVTKKTKNMNFLVKKWFGVKVKPKMISF